MKLNDLQKKQIITEYAQGGVSYLTLSNKYKVTPKTIYNIVKKDKLNADGGFAAKVEAVKKQNEQSMMDYLFSRRDKAQSLIDMLLIDFFVLTEYSL